MDVTITRLKRERNSANGNPRYRVFTDGGTFLTSTDSMVAYLISDSWVGKRVAITLDHHSCITNVEEV